MAGERTRARGELEAAIMAALWSNAAPLTPREIQQRIPGRVPAYTTLLTALDRLTRKGRVARIGDGPRGIRFQAGCSEAEHASQVMLDTLSDAQDRSAALLRFAGELAPEDIALLQQAIGTEVDRPSGKGNK